MVRCLRAVAVLRPSRSSAGPAIIGLIARYHVPGIPFPKGRSLTAHSYYRASERQEWSMLRAMLLP